MEIQMHVATYAEPKTFFPFGDNKIVAFLNEETVENWKQDNTPEDAPAITGYRYTGPRKDGGTLLRLWLRNGLELADLFHIR